MTETSNDRGWSIDACVRCDVVTDNLAYCDACCEKDPKGAGATEARRRARLAAARAERAGPPPGTAPCRLCRAYVGLLRGGRCLPCADREDEGRRATPCAPLVSSAPSAPDEDDTGPLETLTLPADAEDAAEAAQAAEVEAVATADPSTALAPILAAPVYGPKHWVRTVLAPVVSRAWGTRVEAKDEEGVEDGIPEPDEALLERFQLAPDYPRLPANLWQGILSLYFHFLRPPGDRPNAPDSQSEVSVLLARRKPDFREWRVFVSRQEVGGAHVRADLTRLVDLITGEEFPHGLPEEYGEAGTSHSHDVMDAFFSSVDNADELGRNGMHIVIGRLTEDARGRHYKAAPSIVQRGKRYLLPLRALVESEVNATQRFHPKVLEYVSKHDPSVARAHEYGRGERRDDIDWSKYGFSSYRVDGTTVWRRDSNGTVEKTTIGRDRDDDFNLELFERAYGTGRAGPKDDRRYRIIEELPSRVRLGIHSTRQASLELPREHMNSVRAVCNALERCAKNPKAMQLLRELAIDVACGDERGL